MILDMKEIYEVNLNKYYSQLDTNIAKIYIYEKNKINELICSLENTLLTTQKATKDYIIFLTLNEPKKYYEQKIKITEKKLKDYENKIKEIKKKYNTKEFIPSYKNEDNKVSLDTFKSYDKMNKAIITATNIEYMSGNILINLEEQTKGMKNISNKILNTNDNLDESKNNINQMINKENEDKKIIIFIGGFLSFILLFYFFIKIYKKYSQ